MPSSIRSTRFQSTPPVRGATELVVVGVVDLDVSIHAPRAGSDAARPCDSFGRFQSRPPCGERRNLSQNASHRRSFNPRPPCGERHRHTNRLTKRATFQSTPPVRGATATLAVVDSDLKVSIHAPRAGSDMASTGSVPRSSGFNPRPPCGERRLQARDRARLRNVSIHAPRAGRTTNCRKSHVHFPW